MKHIYLVHCLNNDSNNYYGNDKTHLTLYEVNFCFFESFILLELNSMLFLQYIFFYYYFLLIYCVLLSMVQNWIIGYIVNIILFKFT